MLNLTISAGKRFVIQLQSPFVTCKLEFTYESS